MPRADPRHPEGYSRRVLVIVAGLTPQVVTETVYALACKDSPRFVPHEIFVVTTGKGAREIRDNLLRPRTGQFHRLRADYRLPRIAFDDSRVLCVTDESGEPLDDAHDEEAFLALGDILLRKLGQLTADPACAVHLSIAGGRKSMGYLAGHALSLLGRPQDRLSHVLVDPPFENNRAFYYPPPPKPEGTASEADFSRAVVRLAYVPVLFLRDALPPSLLNQVQSLSFTEIVQLAQKSLEPPLVEIDTRELKIAFSGQTVPLGPEWFAFYLLLVKHREDGIAREASDEEATGFLDCLTQVLPGATELASIGHRHHQIERLHRALFPRDLSKQPVPLSAVDRPYARKIVAARAKKFEEARTRVNTALDDLLGPVLGARYRVMSVGGRGQTRYVLPENVEVKFADNRPRREI